MNKNVNTTTVAHFVFKLHFDFGDGQSGSSRPELRTHRKYFTAKLSLDEMRPLQQSYFEF